jgi:hypothetical protein
MMCGVGNLTHGSDSLHPQRAAPKTRAFLARAHRVVSCAARMASSSSSCATAAVSPALYGSAVVAHADKLLATACAGVAVAPAAVTRVFYHGSNCPDGFAAAFVAQLRLGAGASYEPQEHGAAPPTLGAGETAVVLDFCFKADVTARLLAESAGRFLVLDHHASAEKELAATPAAHKVFVMGQSGATLAWDFFHGPAPAPLWLRYVEDKDIWRWALRDSEAFTAGFSMLPQTFEAYGALHAGGDAAVAALIAKGASVLEYRKGVIASHVKRATRVTMKAAPAGLAAASVNCTTLASEVGNAVCTTLGVDFAAVWSYDHAKREFYVSLRSVDGDRADVSAIAKGFGGGGHKCAAGFSYKGASIEDLFAEPAAGADDGVDKRARVE